MSLATGTKQIGSECLAAKRRERNRVGLRLRILNLTVLWLVAIAAALPFMMRSQAHDQGERHGRRDRPRNFDEQIRANANDLFDDGRNTFRFDTFGDEAFWGGTLHLHQAIEGANLGGVGPGVSPNTALALGLKV